MKHKLGHFGSVVRKLLPFIAPYKGGFILSVLMVCVTTGALAVSPSVEGMATSLLVKNAADMINHVPGAGVEFDKLLRIIAMLLLLYIAKTVSQSVMAFALTNSIQSAMHDLRDAVENKISRLPVKYFDTHQFGDVLSRVTNDLDTVSNALQQTVMQILSGILTLCLAFFMMFRINVFMTWVVFLIIPAALLITKFVVKRSQRLFIDQQNTLGQLNGAVTEMYGGYKEIMLFNRQEEAVKEFENINEQLRKNSFKAQFMSSIISPLVSMATYIVIGLVGIIGCLSALGGNMEVGQIQAFVRYVWQVNEPMSQVSNFSAQIQSAFAALRRIVEILDEEEVVTAENPVSLPAFSGNVTFEHVKFGYHKNKTIIRIWR